MRTIKTIATKKTMNLISEQYGIATKKKYGQNFIIEARIVEKIAEAAILNNNDIAIEIGPGIGALTQQLALRCQKVIAFEIDYSLKKYWDDTTKLLPNVEIYFEDFLTADIDKILDAEQEYVVAANLPYYITTPILFKLFEKKWKKITVMMQKEVAERFYAQPNSKTYNALSVIAQFKYDIKKELNVSKNVFIPVPNVESTVISFVEKNNRPQIEESEFAAFVHTCFTQRRKTIFNNLRVYNNDELVIDVLTKGLINPKQRAQELTIAQFVILFELAKEYKLI